MASWDPFQELTVKPHGGQYQHLSTDGGLLRWPSPKEPTCNAGDIEPGSIIGREDLLEEGMATHSFILAWRGPWTEEPDGLQPMGSQRVGHD